MTIELISGRYFSQMWFLEGGDKDWLAALYRDSDGAFVLVYRFRYYNSPDPFDTTDTKNWYKAKFQLDRAESACIDLGDQLASGMMAMGFGPRVHKLLLRTDDPEKIGKMMETQNWAHMQRMDKEPEKKEVAP